MRRVRTRSAESNARRGYTLAQLMIAVMTLAVLVALVAPRLVRRVYPGDARVPATIVQMHSFQVCIDKFHEETGRLPSRREGLRVLITGPRPGGARYLDAGEVPKDPWGHDYVYSSMEWSYEIHCVGPDGIDGTEDDVVMP